VSQIVNPQVLLDYSARTWVTDEVVFSSTFGKEFRTVQRRVNQLNDAIYDTNNRHAASVQPTSKVAGQVWFDSSNKFWMGDPDGSGADDNFATRLTAYQHSYVTAGTDTFKLSGVTQRNTTENARTTTGVLRAFTIAAGVLGTNDQALRLTAWFATTGDPGTCTIQVRFGTTPTSRIAFSLPIQATGACYIKAILTRISATAVDVAGYAFSKQDAASVADFDPGSADINLAVAQILDLNLSAINTGTVTFQGAFVEILN